MGILIEAILAKQLAAAKGEQVRPAVFDSKAGARRGRT
jgi:hypothetical protein